MKKTLIITMALLLAGVASAGVAKKKEVFHNISSAPLKPAADGRHRGTVLETMNVDVYTYMQIEENGKKIWLATPSLDVKKGDKVETSAGNLMTDFFSKQLNKTFEEIYFVTDAKVVGDKPKSAKDTAPAAPKKPIEKHKGKVLETMDVESYTYLLVEEYGRKVWLAAPKTAVKAGDRIEAQGGMPMLNFRSKTLNRTFDEIYFVGGLKVTKGAKAADKPKSDKKKPEKKKDAGKKPEEKKDAKDTKETKESK